VLACRSEARVRDERDTTGLVRNKSDMRKRERERERESRADKRERERARYTSVAACLRRRSEEDRDATLL
jgi:hypothetical protein